MRLMATSRSPGCSGLKMLGHASIVIWSAVQVLSTFPSSAAVAQLTVNQLVAGSNPASGVLIKAALNEGRF